MASLGEAVVEVGADTSGFRSDVEKGVESSLSSASKSMKNLGKGMTQVGQKMTLGVTAPLVGIGLAAVKTAGDFESSMNVLQAATGTSDKAMATLEKQAIELGASTVFSANEAADAMLELGKAGFSTAEITAAVPQVMNLAATEGLELANAAGIVSSALSQFNLEADESGQVVNALAGASNASRSSVATLAESMKLVGSAAAGIGLSVQETAGALAALSDSGLDGSVAGTSLAGVFNRLIPTTDKAASTMKRLGLDFTNAKGEFDSVDVIAQKLQNEFGGMSEEARKVQLGAIFGRDASTLAAVNALISSGGEGLRDYTKAASDQNAAQKLAEARMKGVQGAIEKMKGSLETAGLVIGQALIPVVTKVADFIAKMAEKFSNLSPTVQKVILVVAGVAAAIGPLLIVAGSLITAVGAIAGVFAGVTAAIFAPIAVIVLIVGAIALLLARSEKARAVVTGAFEEIKTAIMDAIGPITEMIQGQLLPAFEAMWPILEKIGVIVLQVFAGAVVGAIKGAIQVIQGIVQVITGVVQVVSGILTGDWAKAWEGVKNIVSGAFTAIIGAIKVYLNIGILSVFRRGFSLLTGLVRGSWNAIKGLFKSGMSALGSVLRTIGNVLLAPFRLAFNVWRAIVRAAWNTIRGIFSGGLGAIRGVIVGAFNFYRSIISGGLGAIRSIFSTGWNALKGIVTRAWAAVSGAVRSGVTKATNFVKELPGKAAAVISGAAGELKAAGEKLIGGLVEGVTGKIGEAVDVVKKGLDKIKGLLPGSPIKWGPLLSWNNGGAGKRLMALLRDGLIAGIPGVVQAVDDAAALISNGFAQVDVGPATQGMTDAFTAATEAITAATDAQLARQKSAAEKQYDAQKTAADKAYAADKKALEKRYGGKGESKALRTKLAALKTQHDNHMDGLERKYKKHVRELEKSSRSGSKALIAAATKDRASIMAQAASWDALKVQLDSVTESYDTALADLTTKTEEMQSLSEKVRDSLIKSVFTPGDDVPVSFENMLTSLEDQETAAKRYGEVMTALAGLNLNATSYQQIADAGVDGLAAAEALLNSGQAGVDQVNALQASINSYAQTAGDTVAQYLLGAGVTLAQSTVDEFARQQGTLEAQMTALGQSMAEAFADALAGLELPGSGGGGGGSNAAGRHQWVPISKTNRKCKICGKARGASVHTNESNAAGTLSSAGGWMEVGERGPELVRLPGGSRVYPAQQSDRMAGGGDEKIEIHVHMPTGDPEAAAEAMMTRLARRGR